MKMNKILFQCDYGLTLSIAQLETDPFKRDAPEIALIDKNGEFVTDYYDNYKKQLTGGGEVIEKAQMLDLIILLRQIQFKGSPDQNYYDEKQFQNEQTIIEPIAANAAKLEKATRPVNDNSLADILAGTMLEITPDDIERFEQRKNQAGK